VASNTDSVQFDRGPSKYSCQVSACVRVNESDDNDNDLTRVRTARVHRTTNCVSINTAAGLCLTLTLTRRGNHDPVQSQIMAVHPRPHHK